MDKTYETELRRVFLIEDLPAPLTRASRHLQIFDNYIERTRLRLRSVRVPETKQWTWVLQQRIALADLSQWKVSEIHLNEAEHAAFEIFHCDKSASAILCCKTQVHCFVSGTRTERRRSRVRSM